MIVPRVPFSNSLSQSLGHDNQPWLQLLMCEVKSELLLSASNIRRRLSHVKPSVHSSGDINKS